MGSKWNKFQHVAGRGVEPGLGLVVGGDPCMVRSNESWVMVT